MKFDFDVIVVGAGHAGIEAAVAASRLGVQVGLVTNNLDRIGYMSCNPSIGGLGKGHMVKELDIFGAFMPRAADKNCIQFRRLNASKGPAVRGSRAQCDKDLYCKTAREFVISIENLKLIHGEASSLVLEKEKCQGVVLKDGSKISSKTVVLATGTFMNAVMHFGLKRIEGGRIGDESTVGISDQMRDFGFEISRLKTGTPARIHRDSVDWDVLREQPGDDRFIPFSYFSDRELKLPQIKCHVSHTNERTHEIIRNNLDKSPMFSGAIEGIGPRYCPSIEDKITRFADKEQHLSFLEPEGLNTEYVYVQGISTSLPEDVQYEFLKTMDGLLNVKIIKPGYAVEYDFVSPFEITHEMQSRKIDGLFLSGQINGTSGYEEAGAQGFLAGTNAALQVQERPAFRLERHEAYMGVLIDDLVTKGTKEPYRMMTSRAEHRLVLREDNNIERLAQKSFDLGLLKDEEKQRLEKLIEERSKYRVVLQKNKLVPNAKTQETLQSKNSAVLLKPLSGEELLRRKEITSLDLRDFELDVPTDIDVWEPVEIEVKYKGYISRQQELIGQAKKMESQTIPKDLNYSRVVGLSREEIEKLVKVQPRTLGQVQRISGVNPSAVQALMIHLKAHRSSIERRQR